MSDTPKKADAAALRVVPLVVTGGVLLLLAAGLGLWLFVRGDQPFAIDVWWNSLLVDAWFPALQAISLAMNFLGGGWFAVLVVPIGGAIILILLRKPWSAAYYIAAQAVSAGVVQILKHTFGRARPEEIAILSDYGSFPSGHVAGAATLATALFVLVPRVGMIVVGAAWVFLMAFSRTYLHAHWLSDTLGGALVGVGAALVVAAVFVRPLERERRVSPRGHAADGDR
ncbi:phosphatase PAP2 family protein [Microbacterium koreense]|uniref:Phosphatase PAP2 family protein n=1 Tax=Microbacterium koreense TaxID=323761 RepID=A0ABW2ZQF3_9MICO